MADLLFLTQRIPYPPIKGEKIRSLQILRHLRQSYDVHFGCLVDDPNDLEHIPTIRDLCASAYFATLNRRMANFTCLTGLLTGEPLSVTFYRDRGLANWTRQTVKRVKPSVLFVCSSNMAPYILDLRTDDMLCVVDLMDVDSEKWRSYAAKSTFPMSWVYRREWRCLGALESRIARECDWSIFVSEAEADLFRQLQPGSRNGIRAVSNGVDLEYFDPQHSFTAPFATDRWNFVFTGTMDYPPNVDAAAWFADEILPLIRRTAPDAQFHIVGSHPSPQVQALAAEGIYVTGRVPDVRPYLAYATAGVAPMRIARGIQNKVLEAMAMCRPTVVTTDALTGIRATPGREVMLADSAKDFARACKAAADRPELGVAARQRMLRDYAWPEKLKGFDALLAHKPGQDT